MKAASCLFGLSTVLFAAIISANPGNAIAADLQPKTLKAWHAAVEKTERRVSSELKSGRGFLALDFHDSGSAAKERKELLSGSILVKNLKDNGKEDEVPDGSIHHWRGGVFIPGVTLDLVFSRIKNPELDDAKQQDVLESRVLENNPGKLKLYLKLQRSKIVTVVYNTEHVIQYQRHGTGQASSSSVAVKIAEVENFRERTEREKPEGHDHGYLWRMNSYWRYQEVRGGVIVECESMTLSRSVPALLEYMVRPLINSVARESMRRTLDSLRARMIRANQLNSSVQAGL